MSPDPKEALEAARDEGLAVDASCVGEAAVRLGIRSDCRVRKPSTEYDREAGIYEAVGLCCEVRIGYNPR